MLQAKEKKKSNEMKKKKSSAPEPERQGGAAATSEPPPTKKQKRLVEDKKDVLAFVESVGGETSVLGTVRVPRRRIQYFPCLLQASSCDDDLGSRSAV